MKSNIQQSRSGKRYWNIYTTKSWYDNCPIFCFYFLKHYAHHLCISSFFFIYFSESSQNLRHILKTKNGEEHTKETEMNILKTKKGDERTKNTVRKQA